MKRLTLLMVCCLLFGCAPINYSAPVSNAWHTTTNPKGSYIVRRGDTLYAVAWRYDMDFRDLAQNNGLSPPYHLNTGQKLSISPVSYKIKKRYKTKQYVKKRAVITRKSPVSRSKTRRKLSNTSRKPIKSKAQRRITRWYWPVKGRVIKGFSLAKRNKGIDIAGRRGEAVRATASGQVAYSGNGLPGYGNLLIVKHNDDYLSAYAHNRKLLVKEGQRVKAGQKIAEMGSTGSNRVMLHFEIRKAGKPVNPLHYLPRR